MCLNKSAFRWLTIGLLGLFGFISCNNTPKEKAFLHPEQKDDSAKKAYLTKIGDAPKTPEQPFVADSNKLYVYLTFDDGPQPGSVTCYHICKAEAIKASFFMVALHQQRKRDGKQIVGMIRNGYPQFLLANHSFDHTMEHYQYFYQHPDMAFDNFIRAQDTLQVSKKIIRLPGNGGWVLQNQVRTSHLVSAVAHRLDSAGFTVIGWDVEWNFNHKNARPVQSPEKLAAQVDSAFSKHNEHIRKNIVILTHDRMFQRAEDSASLVKFIQILKQNPKYVFETVDHYPGAKK
jgi:peptidoglycan/xylan/chitin deacetylase (PgdA/CDA1 family)